MYVLIVNKYILSNYLLLCNKPLILNVFSEIFFLYSLFKDSDSDFGYNQVKTSAQKIRINIFLLLTVMTPISGLHKINKWISIGQSTTMFSQELKKRLQATKM